MKDKIKKFKVGMKVVIYGQTENWNSRLNQNDPRKSNIKFPYHCTIKEIDESDNFFSAMTCGYYGWSLNSLINENLIIDIKEIRKDKLKKIDMIKDENFKTNQK
jgi:hypothetical protein